MLPKTAIAMLSDPAGGDEAVGRTFVDRVGGPPSLASPIAGGVSVPAS